RRVKNHAISNNDPQFSDHDAWSLDNDIPDGGVIFVENDVWLEGTLGTYSSRQRLTVVAANLRTGDRPNVFIGNDITYYNNVHDGSNILGIVAQNDIEIIKNSQDDLHTNGALLAQTGRVGRSYY